MARFNPQAFLAGMQSLIAPQQQADQQIAQMRMQQMDRARENESLINQRQMQGEQLGIQRAEAERAGQRFTLEQEAAKRQKEADDRNKDVFDLSIDEKKVEALGFLRKPVSDAKAAYDAKLAIYNNALANPNIVNKPDWNKISNELTTAATAYKGAYNTAVSTLPYMSRRFGFDETALGAAPETVLPISRDEAILKTRPRKAGSQLPPAPPVPTEVGAVKPSVDPAIVEQGGAPVPVASLMQQPPATGGMNPLTLLSPVSLGIGVNAPPVGATKKTIPVAKKPIAPPTLPPVKPRERLFEYNPELNLDPNQRTIVRTLQDGYKAFAASYFNVRPSDKNFNEKWHRHINNPELMTRFLAGTARDLRENYGDADAKQMLAEFEQSVLDSIGKQALVPTAVTDALLTTEKKGLDVDAARSEAEWLKKYRPLQEEEMLARIDKYKAAAGKGASKAEAWTFSDRNSATRLAETYASDLVKNVRQFMGEYKKVLDEKRKADSKGFADLVNDGKSEVWKQQRAYNQARDLLARIETHKQKLRASTGDPNRFYALLQNDPRAGVTAEELKGLITAASLYNDEAGPRSMLQSPDGGQLDDIDLSMGNN
jgi:hypothetical protein